MELTIIGVSVLILLLIAAFMGAAVVMIAGRRRTEMEEQIYIEDQKLQEAAKKRGSE